jgi:hypothetical protein
MLFPTRGSGRNRIPGFDQGARAVNVGDLAAAAAAARSRVDRYSRIEVNASQCAHEKDEMISGSVLVMKSSKPGCTRCRKLIQFI